MSVRFNIDEIIQVFIMLDKKSKPAEFLNEMHDVNHVLMHNSEQKNCNQYDIMEYMIVRECVIKYDETTVTNDELIEMYEKVINILKENKMKKQKTIEYIINRNERRFNLIKRFIKKHNINIIKLKNDHLKIDRLIIHCYGSSLRTTFDDIYELTIKQTLEYLMIGENIYIKKYNLNNSNYGIKI